MYCFLPARLLYLVEVLGELLEVVIGGLAHFVEHIGIDMLGRNFQKSAHMVLDKLLHVFRRTTCEIHADAARDEHLLNAFNLSGVFHELHERRVVGAKQFADRGMHARLAPTDRFDFGLRALHLVHVGGWPADVADGAFEASCPQP